MLWGHKIESLSEQVKAFAGRIRLSRRVMVGVSFWPFVSYSFEWAVLGGFGAEAASAVLLKSRYWAASGAEGQHDTWLRLRETLCWLYDVSVHGADAFREGQESWRACLYVRYLHSRVRASIFREIRAKLRSSKRESEDNNEKEETRNPFDVARWGQPLNQAELIGTLLGSSAIRCRCA